VPLPDRRIHPAICGRSAVTITGSGVRPQSLGHCRYQIPSKIHQDGNAPIAHPTLSEQAVFNAARINCGVSASVLSGGFAPARAAPPRAARWNPP